MTFLDAVAWFALAASAWWFYNVVRQFWDMPRAARVCLEASIAASMRKSLVVAVVSILWLVFG